MDGLTYPEVGATAGPLPAGYHHLRAERVIGRGAEAFARASADLLAGESLRRAGMRVALSDTPIRRGTRVRMLLRCGPVSFRIPCLVVWAERTPTRCGFAYGTLPGHPERGEERFEVVLTEGGDVVYRITAFSVPARWFTRVAPPLNRRVQAWMTGRYLDALVEPAATR